MDQGVRKQYLVTLDYNGAHPNPQALVHHALANQFLIESGTVEVTEIQKANGGKGVNESPSKAQEIEDRYEATDCWWDGPTKSQIEGQNLIEEIFNYAKEMEEVLRSNGFRWDGKAWVKE